MVSLDKQSIHHWLIFHSEYYYQIAVGFISEFTQVYNRGHIHTKQKKHQLYPADGIKPVSVGQIKIPH